MHSVVIFCLYKPIKVRVTCMSKLISVFFERAWVHNLYDNRIMFPLANQTAGPNGLKCFVGTCVKKTKKHFFKILFQKFLFYFSIADAALGP